MDAQIMHGASEKKRPSVAILIVNWNGWQDTLACLESVFRTAYPDYRVVLLDNNSGNDSVARIKEWAEGDSRPLNGKVAGAFPARPLPYMYYDRQTAEQGGLPAEEERLAAGLPAGVPHPLVIVQTGKNLGFAGGNNVGIRYALKQGADYILLFNNDALMRSAFALSAMVDFMEQQHDAGACGARLFYFDGAPQASYGKFPAVWHSLVFLFPLYKLFPAKAFRRFKRSNIVPDASQKEPLAIDYPSGACLLVRKKAIDDVGLLDERFFMYAEETDWCLRMKKRGWGRYYVPQAEVLHKYAGSFGTAKLKMRKIHLESLFKYYKKHVSNRSLWVLSLGYVLRSLFSTTYWRIASLLLPAEKAGPAQDEALYWLAARDQARQTIKELVSGALARDKGGARQQEAL